MNSMELSVTQNELKSIINALRLGGDPALYQKLKLVLEYQEQGLPYKKILREQYGYVV